jgi:hypothetical protein
MIDFVSRSPNSRCASESKSSAARWLSPPDAPNATERDLPARRPEPHRGTTHAEQAPTPFPSCPIPEAALSRSHLYEPGDPRYACLASKGRLQRRTEVVNLLIEKTRRFAHGFRNFDNYRLRILLVPTAICPYRKQAEPCSIPKSHIDSRLPLLQSHQTRRPLARLSPILSTFYGLPIRPAPPASVECAIPGAEPPMR